MAQHLREPVFSRFHAYPARVYTGLSGVFALLVVGVLISAAKLYGADAPAIPIQPQATIVSKTFRFDVQSLKEKPRSVVLAGSFNHFSHDAAPMHDDGGGIYTLTLDLAPGLYHYKFLINGDQWFTDPASDRDLEDVEDHHNSGVIVGTDGRKLPAPRPNAIEPRGISHNPDQETDANIASPTLVRLRMRTQADDVQAIVVHFRTPEEPQWKQTPLSPIDRQLGLQNFGGVITPQGSRVEYFFELIDGTAKAYLASATLYASLDSAKQHPYGKSTQPKFETPDWAKHAVWYQIFVERFRNGDPGNDPPNTQRWQSRWYGSLPGEPPAAEFYKFVSSRRYGGDIQGVREELPYLRQLGITAIYLNPIFQADSSHKYDTRDYRHVDDYFGVKDSAAELTGENEDPATWQWSKSDKVFLDFVAEAHRQGFKVILDGVFNHVGKSHPFFQDVAKNGRQSRFAGWFEILDWGTGGKLGEPGGMQYMAWERKNGSLPVLKKDPKLGLAHGPREHILAITSRWLAPDGDPSRGVDGFRLDAANEVPHPFWVDWRKLVKSIKPDAYITGEIWGWAQPWLQGDEFDAVMNYQFAMATQSFFVDGKSGLTPTQFQNRLSQLFYNYPLQVVLAQQNLFDSHDTDRFVSRFLNPDRRYDQANRLQDNGKDYDPGKPLPIHFERARQAVAFQMTFAGAPMIYYGDEAGMWSPDDPSDRMPMWWKDREPFDEPEYRFDQGHFDFYQRAIAVRRQLPVLQTGSFRPVLIDDARGIYGFAREGGGQQAFVVLNRSSKPTETLLPMSDIAPNSAFVNWLDPAECELVSAGETGTDGRPILRLETNAKLHRSANGSFSIPLSPYGTAVLTVAPQ